MHTVTTRKHFLCISFILASFLFSGCATTYIKVDELENPPPKFKFADFSTYEMNDIIIAPEYDSSEANIKAKNKIQETLNSRLATIITAWGQKQVQSPKGTLVIEPRISQIKFIGGNARFWAGALAGSSAINMEVTYRDKETGEVVAQPKFYQHANAMAGAWSIGATDNVMLDRIASLIIDYTVANYETAIGGATGKPKE